MTKVAAAIAAVLLMIPTAAPAYDASPFGINGLNLIHARQSPTVFEDSLKTVKVMEDAGIHWARLELWWGVLEPEKGKFDWTFSDKVAQLYRDQGMNGMVILCYSSAWSEGVPPGDAEERARYADYVYQVVNRYKGTFKVWEIWNEPNIPTFWKKPNVEHYTLMLKEAYKAAKKADPDCVVLAASTSGPDLDFIKGIYKYGGWDSCDGISIHPYSMSGGPIPQRLDKILRMHQEWIGGHATCRPVQTDSHSVMNVISVKSLWITEMGWTTEHSSWEQDQAIYLTQSYVVSLANGVEKLFWFCLNDWGEKWGIIKGVDPLNAKPSYYAYQRLTKALGSPGKPAWFEGYLRMPLGVACYVFNKPKYRVLILWSERLSRTVRLPAGFHGEDILGNPAKIQDGKIAVGRVPIILIGPICPMGPIGRQYNPYLEKKGQNLAINGSFDILNHEGQSDWWNAGRFEGSAKDGKFATVKGRRGKCVSISKSGERAAYDEGPIPVDVGKKYRLTGWIKTENATGNNQIALFFYSGNMWTYQREVRSENVTGTNDWTKVAVEAVVPEGTTFVRVNLISEENSGTTWFDDVVLVEE